MKEKIQIGISVFALLALLTYTLVHTGGLLARYVDPPVIGYVAAFGIEAAVVSLSLRIGELRRSKQSTGFFYFVLVSVVVVSAVANIAEGFTAVQGERLTTQTIRQLDLIQAFFGLAATGLVSLIVLALAEIIGTDVATAVQQPTRQRKPNPVQIEAKLQTVTQTTSTRLPKTADTDSIERARAIKAEKDANGKTAAVTALLSYVNDNPDASMADIGQHIERSKTTVSNYLRELEQDGRLQRNGSGWQVLS